MGMPRPIPWGWAVGDVGAAAGLQSLTDGITFAQNPPCAIYQQTTAQATASSAFTPITWPTPVLDTYSGYSVASPTRYTPQEPGYYIAFGQVAWAPNATGGRVVAIAKNGSTDGSGPGMTAGASPGSGFNAVGVAVGADFFNGSTDFLELTSDQKSTTTLNTVPAFTRLVVCFLHA